MRKSGPDVPPGYDPALDAKPKTKAAKRNERRKEKRQQVGPSSLSPSLSVFVFGKSSDLVACLYIGLLYELIIRMTHIIGLGMLGWKA